MSEKGVEPQNPSSTAPTPPQGEQIRREDRRGIPRSLMAVAACFVAGALVGLCMHGARNGLPVSGILGMIPNVGGWIVLACLALLAVACVPLCVSSVRIHRQIKGFAVGNATSDASDADDVDMQAGVLEDAVNRNLGMSDMCAVILLFLLGAAVAADYAGKPALLPVMIALYAVTQVAVLFVQWRSVNDSQLMNPARTGSAFDLRYDEKAARQADEGERLALYKAAYAAHKAVFATCLVMWVITFCIAAAGGPGMVPMTCVTIIWLVDVTVFSIRRRDLSR